VKTLGRLLLILAAALVIVGATYGLAQAGFLRNLMGGRGELFEFEGGEGGRLRGPEAGFEPRLRPGGEDASGQFGQARPERFGAQGRDGGREGGSLFGVGEVVKNLAIIGVIVLAVVALTVAGDWLRRRWRRPPPAAV